MNSTLTASTSFTRLQEFLGRTTIGKLCQLTQGDSGLILAIPTDKCPGKLMNELAELAHVRDSDIVPFEVGSGAEKVTITLGFAKLQSPLGCKGIPGGRSTHKKMLELVGTHIAKPAAVSVIDL